MPDYSDYKIDVMTIEARYDPALAIWDKAGEIWAEVQSQFPELQFQSAMPTQQVFESNDTTAATELEAFRVSCRGVDAEKRVVAVAQKLLQVCSVRLKIAVFTRIGFRDIRSHLYSNMDEANSAVSPLLPEAFTRGLIDKSKYTAITCSVKQESDTSGLRTSIRTEERETKVTIPWVVRDRISADLTKENVVVFDSDYYTIGTTRRESLNIEEWAKQANRTIKRHWKSVLQ